MTTYPKYLNMALDKPLKKQWGRKNLLFITFFIFYSRFSQNRDGCVKVSKLFTVQRAVLVKRNVTTKSKNCTQL